MKGSAMGEGAVEEFPHDPLAEETDLLTRREGRARIAEEIEAQRQSLALVPSSNASELEIKRAVTRLRLLEQALDSLD